MAHSIRCNVQIPMCRTTNFLQIDLYLQRFKYKKLGTVVDNVHIDTPKMEQVGKTMNNFITINRMFCSIYEFGT